jgi:hypothetical protein
MKQNILGKNLTINTVLFADDPVNMASTEGELQIATYMPNIIYIKYNFSISINKMKMVAMKGKGNVKTKTMINNNINEQISTFA